MRRTSWTTTILAAICGTAAAAEDAPPPATTATALGPVVVTATKRDQDIDRVAGLVGVISPEDFSSRGFTRVDAIDRILPDLTIDQRSSRVYSNVTIRGQSSVDFYNPTVQLLVDGLPQDQALFTQAVPLGLEQVEVLYGPQGTLYGRGAVGGVISVITRKPDGTPSLEATAGLSGRGRDAAVLAGAAMIPDMLFADIMLRGEYIQGDLKELSTGRTQGDGDDAGGRLRLRHAPAGSPLDLMISLARDQLTSDEEYFSPRSSMSMRGVLPVSSHYTLDTTSLGLTGSYDLDGATLTLLTGFQDRDLDRTIFGSRTPEWQRTFSQELRIASSGDRTRAIDYVAGLYHQDLDFRREVVGTGLVSSQNIASWAVFGDATWHATPMIDVSAGLRFDHERVEADNRMGSAAYANAASFSALSPRFGISFVPVDDLTLYGLYSTGFKAGGFTRAVTPGNIASDYAYDPQTSHNFEIGARSRLFDDRLELAVAAYFIMTDDYQLSVGPVQGQYVQNAGEVHSKGLDLRVTAQPTEDLRLTAGIGLNDTWFAAYRDSAGGNRDLTGNTVPYAPRFTANLGADYLVDLAEGGLLIPHAGLTLVGKTWFDEANTVSQSAYALVDFGLAWQFTDAATLDLFVDNLTDRTYAVYGFDAGAPFGDLYQLGDGRTVGGRLHVRF
ncbi:TonB-dependent receptor [Tistrella mobilis]|uniref:TonB-dependent receptor n=1 Tax=Tistrella mobilis TaxID=171437 RepID=UPI003558AA17